MWRTPPSTKGVIFDALGPVHTAGKRMTVFPSSAGTNLSLRRTFYSSCQSHSLFSFSTSIIFRFHSSKVGMSSGSLQLTVGSESEATGELKSCQTHGGKSALGGGCFGGNSSRRVRALRCGMCWRLCAASWERPESSLGGRGGFWFPQCGRWKCSPEQLEGCFGSKMEHVLYLILKTKAKQREF